MLLPVTSTVQAVPFGVDHLCSKFKVMAVYAAEKVTAFELTYGDYCEN
jgi:hypothetical protein